MALRWSQADLEAAIRKSRKQQAIVASRVINTMVTPKVNKYHAKRVQVDNIWFDSKRETARYAELKMMQECKCIAKLQIHPVFPIPQSGYPLPHICDVELDFKYWSIAEDRYVYEDVKGKDTPMSRLKRKLVEAFYSIKVEIVK